MASTARCHSRARVQSKEVLIRYSLIAAGLLAACQTAEPILPASPDYSSMSCAQLLRTQADLRGAFFPDPETTGPTVTPEESSRQIEWLDVTGIITDRGC